MLLCVGTKKELQKETFWLFCWSLIDNVGDYSPIKSWCLPGSLGNLQCNQTKDCYPSLIVLNLLDTSAKQMKKSSSIIFSLSKPLIIYLLSRSKCMRRFSSLSLDDVKFIFIVRWIFHLPDFLRSSTILCRYSLMFQCIPQLLVVHHFHFCIRYTYHQRRPKSVLISSLLVC